MNRPIVFPAVQQCAYSAKFIWLEILFEALWWVNWSPLWWDSNLDGEETLVQSTIRSGRVGHLISKSEYCFDIWRGRYGDKWSSSSRLGWFGVRWSFVSDYSYRMSDRTMLPDPTKQTKFQLANDLTMWKQPFPLSRYSSRNIGTISTWMGGCLMDLCTSVSKESWSAVGPTVSSWRNDPVHALTSYRLTLLGHQKIHGFLRGISHMGDEVCHLCLQCVFVAWRVISKQNLLRP
jgi:hypothetical protein